MPSGGALLLRLLLVTIVQNSRCGQTLLQAAQANFDVLCGIFSRWVNMFQEDVFQEET